MRVYRDNNRRRVPAALKILLSVAVLAGLSLAVACVWQQREAFVVEPAVVEPSEPESASSAAEPLSEPESLSASESEPESTEPESSSLNELSPAEAAEPEAGPVRTYAREAVAGAAPENTPVDYRYFDDALFIGDSITTGIPLYMNTIVPNTAVVAMTGINTDNINYRPCIEIDGNRVTVLEAALTKGERKKIYIMLGANGIALDKESFIKGYRTFVQSVREAFPDAAVYIQSMMPVTVNCQKTYPDVSNERIAEYNEEIRKMALSLGLPYLDLGQALEDENGVLPLEASPLDGMHLTPEYYIRWFDYLRTHTVKE